MTDDDRRLLIAIADGLWRVLDILDRRYDHLQNPFDEKGDLHETANTLRLQIAEREEQK